MFWSSTVTLLLYISLVIHLNSYFCVFTSWNFSQVSFCKFLRLSKPRPSKMLWVVTAFCTWKSLSPDQLCTADESWHRLTCVYHRWLCRWVEGDYFFCHWACMIRSVCSCFFEGSFVLPFKTCFFFSTALCC